MFFASFLIGVREGLEAALIIGILLAYVQRQGRPEARQKIWSGVLVAVVLSVALGAVFTFGRSSLSFRVPEMIGGSMSLLAVVMITGMIFWMQKAGRNMRKDLETSAAAKLGLGAWGMFWLAFITVGREGIETTLLLWGWMTDPAAIIGALVGVAVAVALGVAIHHGVLRFPFSTFFTWSGAFLIIVAARILAYGIHDLQEAAFLPGPFSGAPIAPTHPRTGEVLTGFTAYPFWGAAYPFGWAFNLEHLIDPAGPLAAFLKGIFGFVPQMTWLEVTAWAGYLTIIVPLFISKVRTARRS